MGKKLVIVESPAKAKTIGKILGKEYIIMASMGHIRDLPEKSFGVDIEHGFLPQYEENKSRNKNLSDLKKAAKAASEIYLAPDPDREGEAIAWHLKEVLEKLNSKAAFYRVTFHEITRSAITKAFQNIGNIDMNLVNSQQARRVLDRIVGYQVSPLLWTRIERGVSAGRVQSVALRLVCEREREIQNFVPQEYWNFTAGFYAAAKGLADENIFTAKLVKIANDKVDINSGERAEQILTAVRSVDNWIVDSIEKQPRKKYAAPPFITSTMQQAASSTFGFSANQTMRTAQELYEGIDIGNGGPEGLITYMRTDSVAVAAEAQAACRQFIQQAYGADYVPEKPNFYKSKSSAQGAHEAIRPTNVHLTPAQLKPFLDARQLKLYSLIWKRFVASQMAPALQERTTVTVTGKALCDQKDYSFRSSATVTRFPGFLQAYNLAEEGAVNDEDDENVKDAAVLGALTRGELCLLQDSAAEQKFTEPAPRFSEATLIKELESNGIGRPSTYATIVNTIQLRLYVQKEKGKLLPTELGFNINDYLVDSLPDLFQVGFTALMEEKLDSIESGDVQWTNMLAEFYSAFSQWLGMAKNADAPEAGKAEALFRILETVAEWIPAEKIPGKRSFDDQKFFQSAYKKFQKDRTVSKKQWDVLLGLAVKYQQQLPQLQQTASENFFADDLQNAFEREKELQQTRMEREEKRIKAEAQAPAQDFLTDIFAAMENLEWNPPELRRGRTYDDKKFFTSLKNQKNTGKSLSEKQIAALLDLMGKYAEKIPDFEQLKALISSQSSVVMPEKPENQDNVLKILEKFSKVTQWAEPVKKGRRTYDDKEFVQSLATQVKNGKVLSEKQIAALLKMAAKYQINPQ